MNAAKEDLSTQDSQPAPTKTAAKPAAEKQQQAASGSGEGVCEGTTDPFVEDMLSEQQKTGVDNVAYKVQYKKQNKRNDIVSLLAWETSEKGRTTWRQKLQIVVKDGFPTWVLMVVIKQLLMELATGTLLAQDLRSRREEVIGYVTSGTWLLRISELQDCVRPHKDLISMIIQHMDDLPVRQEIPPGYEVAKLSRAKPLPEAIPETLQDTQEVPETEPARIFVPPPGQTLETMDTQPVLPM